MSVTFDEFWAEAQSHESVMQDGRTAHAAGKGFHEAPYPYDTAKAMAWRIGWNAAALESNA